MVRHDHHRHATPTTTPVTTTVPTTTTETTPGTTTVTITPPCATKAPAPSTIAVPKTNPFKGRAMWIWQLAYSDGGNVAAIIAQAKRYGIGALYIKSSDGTSYWPQFSKALVTDLHEAGIKVCAWQYVYGIQPVAEANLGARAIRDGADCLVIDAESQYQGRYPAAQTYIARLRKLIGNRFPVGLAGFPYVGYHLTFPYSVFLGPNGAQYNLPQMYWADIGTSVQSVYAVTYEYNEIYRRPIFPLGQLWNSGRGMSANSIEQFNLLADQYGATGVSWWDWQSLAALVLGRDHQDGAAARGLRDEPHARERLPRQPGRSGDLGAGAPLRRRIPDRRRRSVRAGDPERRRGPSSASTTWRPAASSTVPRGMRWSR